MNLGKDHWHEARVTIQNLFAKGDTTLMTHAFKDTFSFSSSAVKMQMPV